VLGNNVCGTFVSVISILAKIIAPDKMVLQASFYFSIALLALVACLGTYFLLLKRNFYHHHHGIGLAHRQRAEKEQHTRNDGATGTRIHLMAKLREFIGVGKVAWPMYYNVFFNFFCYISGIPRCIGRCASINLFWSINWRFIHTHLLLSVLQLLLGSG